jgi:hypothetical protein
VKCVTVGEVAGDLAFELPKVVRRREAPRVERREGVVGDVAVVDSVGRVREAEVGSGMVIPAATRMDEGLSIYFSTSRSLFHFMCRSSRLARLSYREHGHEKNQENDR